MNIIGNKVFASLAGGWLLVFALSGYSQQTNPDFELGVRKYHQSDWDGAITNFSKSIEATFDLYNSYSYRAYAKAMKGDSNGAIADCNQVIRFNRNFSGAYFWRARIELMLTNSEQAFADFQMGMKLNSKDRPEDLSLDIYHAYRTIASRQFNAGNLETAMTDINRAILACSTNWSGYIKRAYWKLLGGRYGSAIADANVAIKHFPEESFPFEIRAWARYELNDVTGADADCKEAVKIFALKRSKTGTKEALANLEFETLTIMGLQDYINGDFEHATQKWSVWLDGVDEILKKDGSPHTLSPVTRSYFQKWQQKARAKWKE